MILSLPTIGQTKKTSVDSTKKTPVIEKTTKTIKKISEDDKESKKTIKPSSFVGKVELKAKKKHIYYALSKKGKTIIKADGPGKLEVFLRVRLENNAPSSKEYYVKYIIDNKITKTVKIKSEKVSKNMVYSSKLEGKPSNSSNIKLNLTPGNHTIEFYKGDTKQKIHASFTFTKTTAPIWVENTTTAKLDTVKVKYLENKGEIKKYLRISNTKKYSILTKDTLYLKILVKAELDNTVQSNTFLKLILEENNVIKKTFRISGKKSSKTEYLTEKKLIPGNTNVIYYTILPSKFTYNLYIQDLNKSAIILVYSNKAKINQ